MPQQSQHSSQQMMELKEQIGSLTRRLDQLITREILDEEAVPPSEASKTQAQLHNKKPDVVKWALGLTTLVSVGYFAIDRLGPGLTPFAVVMGIMVLMMGLILVSAVAAGAKDQRGPARVMLWAVTVVFIGAIVLLGTILTIRWPSHLAHLVLPEWAPKELRGTSLAAYDFYPIGVTENGDLYLDHIKFEQATLHFLNERDEKAAVDLIYLGVGNNVERILTPTALEQFNELISQYSDVAHRNLYRDRDRIFEVYKQLVDGVGKTFAGTGIEIVLHDTRNPLSSVVAVQNSITGRRIGSPTTNFGIELIKLHSSRRHFAGNSYIGYPLTTRDGRQIKSTTIPIFDPHFGLIGFVCMNIDISVLDPLEAQGDTRQFIDAFTNVWEHEDVDEVVQNTRK